MAARIPTLLLGALLLASTTAGAEPDPSKKPQFVYPEFGSSHVYNMLDTVMVTYTSFDETAELWTFCDPGAARMRCGIVEHGVERDVELYGRVGVEHGGVPFDHGGGQSQLDVLWFSSRWGRWRSQRGRISGDRAGQMSEVPEIGGGDGGGGGGGGGYEYSGQYNKWQFGGEMDAVNNPVEVGNSNLQARPGQIGRPHHEMAA
ncbi:hypothetical protein N0V88_006238 [Collariella sp. IMI 366227]|nr:hypothetical protein N0V88_006238 [Collariella sp. IMI 366227]